MKVQDAIGQAYKNGYEAGKKDAVVHGRWFQHWGYVECSECRNRFSYLGGTHYCPNCGAKMDAVEQIIGEGHSESVLGCLCQSRRKENEYALSI